LRITSGELRGGRRIESAARSEGRQFVVGVQRHLGDAAAGPKVGLFLAFSFGNQAGVGERGQDVLSVLALDAVEMEVGGVELGAEGGA
jgi:hypothetical protein